MKTKSADIILRKTNQNHSLQTAVAPSLHPESKLTVKEKKKKHFFSNPAELLNYLNLTPEQVGLSSQASQLFQFKAPLAYVENIKPGDPDDPLLKQILPVKQELQQHIDFSDDPLDEKGSLCQPGILKKYHGRVLLLTTPVCAIHCRYCFRRHYPYDDKGHMWTQIKHNIAAMAQDSTIHEVILSGGDPLSLSDKKIAQLISLLDTLPQLRRIRLHTRYPVVVPERISADLLQHLQQASKKIILVLHINHPNELGPSAQKVISSLQHSNITIYNQSVLLKGVNDNLEVLTQLSEKLFEHKIQSYYLHLLDKVSGSAHFDLAEQDALQLYQQLRATLPGYMVPTLVREITGEKNKVPLY